MIEWPSQSPDIMLTKNLWQTNTFCASAIYRRKIGKYFVSKCGKLIEPQPKRPAAVTAETVDSTHYKLREMNTNAHSDLRFSNVM